MKPKTQKTILEFILYFLLLLACILLIINYFLFRTDAGECVRDTKKFLIEHFEEVRGGNITCTCRSDAPIDRTSNIKGEGSKIIFSSHGYDENRRMFYDEGWTGYFDIHVYRNMTIRK